MLKLRTLIEDGNPELLATGFQFTEGPIWQADGSLIFSDIPANRLYRWTAESGAQVWREPTGNANGNTLDRQGRLLTCEHSGRRVSRTAADGTVTALAHQYQGKKLNSPNDIVVKSNGVVYFTDPPYGIKPEEREQPCNGVYRVLPDGAIELLVDDFDRPNGLAFAPDESILYIDDSPMAR
jgi:gluconolactonase